MMSWRSVLGIVVASTILGVLIAAPLGEQREISVRLWVAASGAVLAVMLIRRLLAQAPVDRALVGHRWWDRRSPQKIDQRPAALRSINVILESATESPRAHDVRLRPRLDELALHFLPVVHGVDPRSEPARALAILGDVAWLVDPAVTDRAPTVAEVDRFVALVRRDARSVELVQERARSVELVQERARSVELVDEKAR